MKMHQFAHLAAWMLLSAVAYADSDDESSESSTDAPSSSKSGGNTKKYVMWGVAVVVVIGGVVAAFMLLGGEAKKDDNELKACNKDEWKAFPNMTETVTKANCEKACGKVADGKCKAFAVQNEFSANGSAVAETLTCLYREKDTCTKHQGEQAKDVKVVSKTTPGTPMQIEKKDITFCDGAKPVEFPGGKESTTKCETGTGNFYTWAKDSCQLYAAATCVTRKAWKATAKKTSTETPAAGSGTAAAASS
jgi:hypothetical protein